MTIAVRASRPTNQSPGEPNAAYHSLAPLWSKVRAVVGGEHAVKDYDSSLDVTNFSNLLIPFSPSMTDRQYRFYRAEAEFPGLVAQYHKMLVGGLLRKDPSVTVPDNLAEKVGAWLKEDFTSDGRGIVAFLDEVLDEELTTSFAWILVDFPKVDPNLWDELDSKAKLAFKPYPVLWRAENVINWTVRANPKTGAVELSRWITRFFREEYVNEGDFHPEIFEYVTDHYLDKNGYYTLDHYKRKTPANINFQNGRAVTTLSMFGANSDDWELVESGIQPLKAGEPLGFIPAYPLNGSYQPSRPILLPLVTREIALYNKMSRRNHLLYSAATFTPVIMTSMSSDEFQSIVERGLGSFIHLNVGDQVDALRTPTEALADLNTSIDATVNELARMGIRMLSPEVTSQNQSGVAMEIRNAAQTSQLATLNLKISETLQQVIRLMIEWRYQFELEPGDIQVELSSDFNPSPIGENWIRLATEWVESGLIPRSLWIDIAKRHDIIPSDYDDNEGQEEIKENPPTPYPGQQGVGGFA